MVPSKSRKNNPDNPIDLAIIKPRSFSTSESRSLRSHGHRGYRGRCHLGG